MEPGYLDRERLVRERWSELERGRGREWERSEN